MVAEGGFEPPISAYETDEIDQASLPRYGGKCGVRTHEAVTPYFFSKEAAHQFAYFPDGVPSGNRTRSIILARLCHTGRP